MNRSELAKAIYQKYENQLLSGKIYKFSCIVVHNGTGYNMTYLKAVEVIPGCTDFKGSVMIQVGDEIELKEKENEK